VGIGLVDHVEHVSGDEPWPIVDKATAAQRTRAEHADRFLRVAGVPAEAPVGCTVYRRLQDGAARLAVEAHAINKVRELVLDGVGKWLCLHFVRYDLEEIGMREEGIAELCVDVHRALVRERTEPIRSLAD